MTYLVKLNHIGVTLIASVAAISFFTFIYPVQLSAQETNATQIQLQKLEQNAIYLSAQVKELLASTQTLFTVGENIKIVTAVQVKESPGSVSTLLGTQKASQTGKITEGPVTASGSVWFKVNFTTGVDGWVSENWLVTMDRTGATQLQKSFYSLPSGQSTTLLKGSGPTAVATVSIPAASVERTVQQVKIFASIESHKFVSKPWLDFKEASLWNGDKKIWSKDISVASQWIEMKAISTTPTESLYEITLFTGNLKISPDTSSKLTLKLSTKSTAIGGNTWKIGIPAGGVTTKSNLAGIKVYGGSSNTFSVSIKATEPAYDIIVVAGQSNSVGFNRPSIDMYAESKEFLAQAANVFQVGRFSINKLKIIPAKDPLEHWNLIPGGKGFGLPFALRYAKENPNKKILIIPAGKGGTTIRLWDKQVDNFSWVGAPDSTLLYDDMLNRIATALKVNSNSKVVAVLWQQGEADTNILSGFYLPVVFPFASEGVAGYGAKLSELRNNIRRDIGSTCVPFLAGEMPQAWIAVRPTSTAFAIKGEITNEIKRVMNADTCKKSMFVSSVGAVSNPGTSGSDPIAVDGGAVHFSAAGQYTMGQKYYEAFQNIK